MTPETSSLFLPAKRSPQQLPSSLLHSETNTVRSCVMGSGRKTPKKSTEPVPKKKTMAMADNSTKRKPSPNVGSAGYRSSGKKKTVTKNSKEDVKGKVEHPTSSDESDSEASFENYSELCERVAKTMYYANPLIGSTPRPSLPLTILAVETFSKYARRDTLEFLDIDMAAEIGRNACVSPTALIFALVYLERLSQNNPGYLKTIKPSELFVVSLLVASKFVQDDGEDLGIFNDEWASSASMELKRINRLELEFLTAIDWRVNIRKDEYERTLLNIEEKLAVYQGSKRGWFTYTELQSAFNGNLQWDVVLPVVYGRVVEVISAACVMYTTFFATLITSSVLAPYLLSASRAFIDSGINSLSVGSCVQSSSNTSISLPPTFASVENLATEIILPLMDGDENQTEAFGIMIDEVWKERMHSLLQHKRMLENPYGNGFSIKCDDDPQCYQRATTGSDQALTSIVQRLIENLLKSPTSNSKLLQDYGRFRAVQQCSQNQKCINIPLASNSLRV